MRWLAKFYDSRFQWTATAGIGIHPTKAWLSQLVNFKNAIWTWGHLEERYAIKFCLKLGKNATEMYGMLQTAFRPSCMNRASFLEWQKRFKEGREIRSVGGVRKWENQSWLAKGLGLGFGLLCWGSKGGSGRDSVGRGQHSSNRVSGISSRTMHQSITPSLSQTIWPRWTSRQFHILPTVQTLLPVTFGYSLSSEAVVLRRWKSLWRRSLTRSHKRTSIGPSRSCWNITTSALQPEEITSKGTWVPCVYSQ